MPNKTYLLIVLLSIVGLNCTGQQTLSNAFSAGDNMTYSAIDDYFRQQRRSGSNAVKIYGETKLFPTFTTGFLSLQDGDTIRNLKLQYDCARHQVITSFTGKFPNTFLSIDKVVYMRTDETLLFNPKSIGYEAALEKDELKGLVEIAYVTDDKQLIFGRFYNAHFTRANYNPILETGDKNDQYVLDIDRYFFYDGKYYKLPTSKRKMRSLLESTLSISVDKKIDLTDDESLIKVFSQSR